MQKSNSKKYCCCCGKQIVKNGNPSVNDKLVTIALGSRYACCGDIICGYCAEDLDENGLFPEERMQLEIE